MYLENPGNHEILYKDLDRISGLTRLVVRQRGAEEGLAGEGGVEAVAGEGE
jgi:hypothetical protein